MRDGLFNRVYMCSDIYIYILEIVRVHQPVGTELAELSEVKNIKKGIIINDFV